MQAEVEIGLIMLRQLELGTIWAALYFSHTDKKRLRFIKNIKIEEHVGWLLIFTKSGIHNCPFNILLLVETEKVVNTTETSS